jgi:hypothetical protein
LVKGNFAVSHGKENLRYITAFKQSSRKMGPIFCMLVCTASVAALAIFALFGLTFAAQIGEDK